MRRLLLLAPLLLLVGCAPTNSTHRLIAEFNVAGQETYKVELSSKVIEIEGSDD